MPAGPSHPSLIPVPLKSELADSVAQAFPEAAGLQKVTLHIDDQHGSVGRSNLEVVRFCGDAFRLPLVCVLVRISTLRN